MNMDSIISIAAIIISVITAIDVHNQNRENTKINLRSKYLDDIYKDYLLHKIPEARRYIQFIGNELKGTDKLKRELNAIQFDSLYYYYNNKLFYDRLKDELQNLEDYLVQNEGKRFEAEEQADVLERIREYIKRIYKCINNYYLGNED